MATDEAGGWVVDPTNPNRATYTDESGQTYEALKDPEPTKMSVHNPGIKDLVSGATTDAAPYRGSVERLKDSFADAGQHGFPGWVARKWYDWTDTGKEQLRKAYPGKPDDWYEEQADKIIGQSQAELRKEMEDKAALDPTWRPDESFWQNVGAIDRWGPMVAGQVLGSAGPESLINPGGSALARVGAQGVVGAASDAGYQVLDKLDQVKKDFDVNEMLGAAAAGGALQGAFEIPGFVRNLFKGRGIDTTPGAHPAGATQPMTSTSLSDADQEAYAKLLETGSFDDVMRFFDDKQGFKPKPSEVAQFIQQRDAVQAQGIQPQYSGADIKYRKPQEPELPLQEPGTQAELPLNQPRQPKPAQPVTPEARPTPERVQQVLDEAKSHVETITKDWKNAPDFEIHDTFEHLPDVDQDAIGVTMPDGKVAINMKNVELDAKARGVEPRDLLSAVTFHEGLGHHGLTQQFGTDLESILDNMYAGSKKFKVDTDAWMKANPDAYAEDANPTARAAEEVLAEMSEKGKVPTTVLDKFKNWLKDYGRKMGLKIDYSDREVKSILGLAHNAVVNGKGRDVAANGYRYAKVWHGTPTEQPFEKFDHSKIGSGEGVQVYGWGTYLTDVRNMADVFYRQRLAKQEAEFNGQKYDLGKAGDDDFHLRSDVKYKILDDHPEIEKMYVDDPSKRRKISNVLEQYLAQPDYFKDVTGRQLAEAHTIYKDDYLDAHPEIYDDKSMFGLLAKAIRDNPVRRTQGKGQLLEVEIPDDAKWLELDKPMSQQSPEVRKIYDETLGVHNASRIADKRATIERYTRQLDRVEKELEALDGHFTFSTNPENLAERNALLTKSNKLQNAIEELQSELKDFGDITGGAFYNQLRQTFGNDQKKASEFLASKGITGNKYLTGQSRGSGGSDYNYVVFDDNVPKIVNRYMRKVGKGSRGKEQEIPGIGKVKSTEDIKDIIENSAPETTKESWNDWIEASNRIRAIVKNGRELKGGATPAEVLSARETIVKSANRIARLSRQAAAGTLSEAEERNLLAEIARNADLQDALAGVRSNAARVVNSFRIGVETDQGFAESLRNMSKAANNTVLSDEESRKAFFKMVVEAQDNPEMLKRLTRAAFRTKAEDYIYRGWYNMLLSSPATHTANFMGTGANFLVDLLENTGAAVAGQGKRFSNAERVRGREVAYRVYGALMALKDGKTWANARESLNTGLTGNEANGKAGKPLYYGDNPYLQGISGAVEAPTRFLAGADEWWRNVLQLSNLYGLAVRNAGNKGLKGKAFWDETNRLIEKPTAEMIRDTNDYTKVIQFLDKPSAIGQAMINAQTPRIGAGAGERVLKGALKFAVPFVRTPDALIRTAIRRAGPLGALERENINGWKKGGAERDKVKARLIMGSAISFWLATQAAKGAITGGGPSDYNKKMEWLGSHQENSVKVGDKYVSIAGLEPVSTNINGIATLVERLKAGDISQEDYSKSAIVLAQTLGATLVENSYLEGFTNLMEAGSKNAGMAQSAIQNFIASIAATSVPSIVRKYNQTQDEAVRDSTGDGSLGDRIKGRIMSALPGLSTMLPQKYDVYGRPQTREFAGPDLASRAQVRMKEDDPVIQELSRLADKTDKVIVGPPGKSGIKVNGEEKRLTAEEYQDYQHLSGYWIVESVRQELDTPEWKAMSDEEKLDEIKSIVKDMRKAARDTLFDPEDETPDSEEEGTE